MNPHHRSLDASLSREVFSRRVSSCGRLWLVFALPFVLCGKSIAADCNGNSIDDVEDIRSQSSDDCNADGVPDECESSFLQLGQGTDAFVIPGLAQALVEADLDGDGDLDLATVSLAQLSRLTIEFNESEREPGEFGGTARYPAPDNVLDIAAGDLDSDGDIDLVAVGLIEGENLWIYHNAGDGSFAEPEKQSLPKGMYAACLEDLDGDGALDYVGVNKDLDAILVLLNRGDGTLSGPKQFSTGDTPTSLACADLDGDGSLDVLTGNRKSRDVSILLNDGFASFVAGESMALGATVYDLVAGDWDRDGNVDFAAAISRRIVVAHNDGDGSFTATEFPLDLIPGNLGSGDLDGDGDLDLATRLGSSSSLMVLVNDGSGSFRSGSVAGTAGVVRALVIADFDGDRDADLCMAVANPDLGTFLWNGKGETVTVTSATYPMRNQRPPHTAILADMDGDGDLDLVTGDGGNRTISIAVNDGSGGLVVESDQNTGHYINSIAAADFDADGDLDIVLADKKASRYVVVPNQGDGVLLTGQSRVLLGQGEPFMVTAPDLNGDRLPDIVGANNLGKSVSVMLNTGGGNFESSANYRVGLAPLAVAAGDFDRDGDPDIVAANSGSGTVSILENRGDGTFSAAMHQSVLGRPTYVIAGDWDLDGWIDLATANEGQRSVGILLNRGDRSLAFEDVRPVPVGSPPTNKAPYSLVAADFNGDGFPDLITSNQGVVNSVDTVGDSFSALLNQRDGTFTFLASYRTGIEPRFTPAGDLDGDGDVDLVAANHGSNDLTVFLNQSATRSAESFVREICTLRDLEKIAIRTPGGGLSVKFTLPARDDETLLPTTFQNNRKFALHHEFLRSVFPELFPNLSAEDLRLKTELRASRDYFVGAVELVKTKDGYQYVFSVLTSERREELLSREEVRWVFEKLRSVFALRPFLYAPDPGGNNPLARKEAVSWGANPGFPIFFARTIVDTTYVPYTLAVGYGRVRLFDRESFDAANAAGRFTFQDIPVTDHAPRDIEGVVGGVITATPQGALSHVSIRTARRHTPNAYVAGAMEVFESFADELVRLEVGERKYTIREATVEEAEAFWEENRPVLPDLPPIDRTYDGLDRFSEMDFSGAVDLESRFGGKATNLAHLQTILHGENAEYGEVGFAIPMKYYLDFMEINRLPSIADPLRQISYREYLSELLASPRIEADSGARAEALEVFRAQARAGAVIPEGLVERLAARIEQVFGTDELMVRFRSSSNVEDLLGFNGAGLYESTSACVADSFDADDLGPSICDELHADERSIERALKKVWTSLWTFRAHEERAYYQIPQTAAAMGILVNRAFLDEVANGVAFTGDPLNPRGNCYVVTAQVGEESVVSPEPGKLAERDVIEVVDREVVRIVRSQPSSLVPEGERVLSDDHLRELGALMGYIDETFPLDTEGRPREAILLDLEFKIEPDGSLAVKQIRPFLTDREGDRTAWPRFELEIPGGTLVCGGLNVTSPNRPIMEEYLAKSRVAFRPGVVELPSRDCVFSAELFDEVVVGPERLVAVPDGKGLFRVESLANPLGEGTVYSFTYRQEFSLSEGRRLELQLFDLDFTWSAGVAGTGRLVLDETYLSFDLRLLGFVSRPGESELTIAYSSCDDGLLPPWNIDVVLDDGVRATLRERLLREPSGLSTGPASLAAAEVSLGGGRQLVTDYWDLVYSSATHNTFVKYWILLNRPVSLPGLGSDVHVLEIAAPDAEDAPVDEPQEAAAAYLDENFQVLARPGVVSFEKARLGDDPEPRFVRGDANADGRVDVSDSVRIIDYLFLEGDLLDCRKAGDADDDGKVNINDAIRTLRHLFKGAVVPPPREFCGPDPTPDGLTCERFPTCL